MKKTAKPAPRRRKPKVEQPKPLSPDDFRNGLIRAIFDGLLKSGAIKLMEVPGDPTGAGSAGAA